jgi:hypothetical protein
VDNARWTLSRTNRLSSAMTTEIGSLTGMSSFLDLQGNQPISPHEGVDLDCPNYSRICGGPLQYCAT